jgi:hypothetical protein
VFAFNGGDDENAYAGFVPWQALKFHFSMDQWITNIFRELSARNSVDLATICRTDSASE